MNAMDISSQALGTRQLPYTASRRILQKLMLQSDSYRVSCAVCALVHGRLGQNTIPLV